jgi:hypothetical protein
MTFDFGSLQRPGTAARDIEPRALLRSLPVREGAINDLWDGQAQALAAWHEKRGNSDNLILLNTGAGKTIVGLIIAESLRRESRGNVVYVCPTNDLVKQVSKEASKIGLEFTTRTEGVWSNDLFERGQAIAITNYQAVFNARTTFRGDKAPTAIIFDDAHVAEGVIRDQLTLRITKKDHSSIFSELRNIILRHERGAEYNSKIQETLSGAGVFSTIMASPLVGHDRFEEIDALLRPHLSSKDLSLSFPLAHLAGKWRYCAFCLSESSIEISPPALPSLQFSFLEDLSVKKVYLSATFDQPVDFARAFGKTISDPIRPNVDAGNGERLVLFSSKLGGEAVEQGLASKALELGKLVIAVPSGKKGRRWSDMATLPGSQEFTAAMEAFRTSTSKKAFLLTARYDGIDLPQDACRQMIIDGVPRGVSLIERYCWEYLSLHNDLKSRIATRITQLFGRIIRGRVDHGCFYIMSRELNVWLGKQKNLALLPDLLVGQIQLGEYIHEALGIKTPEAAADLVKQVLSREEGWIKFYRDWLNDQGISEEIKREASEQQEVIKAISLSWVRLWSALWKGDDPVKISRLRTSIEGDLSALALADSRGAGWAGIWLGVSYKIDGEDVFAQEHFSRSRGRLLAPLPLPRAQLEFAGAESISSFGSQLISIFNDGVIQANRKIIRDDMALSSLEEISAASPREYEEALRFLGERLGFESTRPDNDFGSGPDVMWISRISKKAIGFEAKTDKTAQDYNKSDVGQSHNHVQWIADNERDVELLGVALVGTPERCTDESSPGGEIFMIHPRAISQLLGAYKDLRQVVAAQVGAGRAAEVASFGDNDEWAIDGVWQRLGPRAFSRGVQ